ncbi:MAG: putative hydro-lyase [Chloroflexi bacterium]|nr:putative hydro-lyase [Chloroflexota bacterium]
MTTASTRVPATGAEARAEFRQNRLVQPTSGMAPGFVQANLAILPRDSAFEFLLFCQRNPKPCPVIEVIEAGNVEPSISAPGADIRTDIPKYRVYRNGEMTEEPLDLKSVWRDDLVSFLLGCSFSFEHALIENGIALPHWETDKGVSMFRTSIETTPAGPFSGPMVVSMRWVPQNKVVRAVQATTRFPNTHGAPVHVGDPAAIGIDDPTKPDFGDAWEPANPSDVPVFWACGVTPQAVAMASKPPLMITHAPGHMFLTDLKDEDLAII